MQKNAKLILFTIFFEFPLFIIFIVGTEGYDDITNLLPGERVTDLIFFYIFSPIIMILIIQLLSVILAEAFFRLHKIMKFGRYDYGILKDFNEELSFNGILMRAITLGLFAFSIGIYISQLAPPEMILTYGVANNLVYVLVATLFILPFLIIVILPVWLLKDAGIMSARKKKKEGSRQLPDIEGAYRDFHSIIKGYVGISTLFAMAHLITENLILEWNEKDYMLAILLMILTPFHSVAISVPPILFYEFRLERNKERLIKKLQKKNIKVIEDISELP